MISQFISLDQVTRFQSHELAEDSKIEMIIKYHGGLAEVTAALAAQAEILNENYAILTIPLENVPRLFEFRQVEYFELPKNVTYMIHSNLDQSCIPPVQRETGYGLTGQGVLAGIIDSGIDYTHKDFIAPDGTSRVMYLWDQTLDGNPPPGFLRGTLYTNAQLNEALRAPDPYAVVPSRDTVGHGTAIAGIIGGNGAESGGGTFGVAPQVTYVVVKLGNRGNENFSRTTEIMRGIKFITDISEALLLPLALNISYGTNDGAHDGNSLFEQYIDSVAEATRSVICIAAGNEGSTARHYHDKVASNRSVTAEFVVGGQPQRLNLTMWKNFADIFSIEVVAPSGDSTGNIPAGRMITQVTIDNVQVSVLFGQPTNYNISQEIYFSLQAVEEHIDQGLWQIIVRGGAVVDGSFDIWLPTADSATMGTSFLRPDPENTLTLPATARNVISVGGYNSVLNTSADFSGRGKRYDTYGQKPELVAPAVGIYTVKSGGGYDTFNGTSIATPFVTGSCVLMLEWGHIRGHDFFLYGQRIKSFLCKNAGRNPSLTYPNSIWGYGTLKLCNTMDDLAEYNRRGGSFS